MTIKKLTPKQAQVYELLRSGATVTAVAKRLKVTPSAVHGHARRIKEAGWSIDPGTPAVAKPKRGGRRKAEATPTTSSVTETAAVAPSSYSNGNHSEHGIDVGGTIRAAIAEIDARQDAIEGETDALNTQVDNLNDEQRQLEAQKERYAAALEVVV